MRDLGTFGGSFGIANAINESGDVVGYSNIAGDGTEFGFLWSGGALINLRSLGDYACTTANAINARGRVVAYRQRPAITPSGDKRFSGKKARWPT